MPTSLDWYLLRNLKARQLKLLVALDDLGNLKKVAEATHVTLPAVSKALAELEKGLELELFTRTTQGLRPTIYGECLIRYARSMMIELQQARDELKALSSGSGGKVSIGVYAASSSVLVPDAIALLKERSATTNVLVSEGTTSTLLPQLWEGKLDLVVGRLPILSPSSGFEEKLLLEEQLVLVTSPAHPLAQLEHLEWADLKEYPWVLPPLPSQMREPLERALIRNGIELERDYIETSSLHLTRACLYRTRAIAAMASAAAHDTLLPLAVLPLSLPPMPRGAGMLWNRNRPLSPAAGLMIECLEEAAAVLKEKEIANRMEPSA
ncbi:LysR substrate-binding domain-containing protein [Sphingomonas sp.]|uniref:LysR substrate-binding domain-containing protein n=1 Tax=Sphingomonas sp. TaxID=28214 RepID=UPI002B633E82|nr:LysR substrate-binding domain-containing protein [Sphingomonas sp.]HWK35422.1 LysR substrate-binding domain-containing protein [Sphingomonas sp.]